MFIYNKEELLIDKNGTVLIYNKERGRKDGERDLRKKWRTRGGGGASERGDSFADGRRKGVQDFSIARRPESVENRLGSFER